MQTYLFAYGSLINQKSRKTTLPDDRSVRKAALAGYRRVSNAPFDGYAYFNIASEPESIVHGVLIAMTREEIELFSQREEGYRITHVTNKIQNAGGTVYAFIAPNIPCDLPIPLSYLNTCLAEFDSTEREQFMAETSLAPVFDDTAAPLYEFAAD